MSSEGKVSFKLKRFAGIKRDYTPEEVERLKGSIKIEHSICKQQSEKLWKLLNTEPHVNTLGSLSGNQAVQHAKAGLKAIYLRDDHCDWGSSGMEDISVENSDQTKNS